MLHPTWWIFLLILILSIFHFQFGETCSCAMQHPQSQFCESDFVAVIRVKRFTVVNDHEATYKVKIQKIFKASQKAEHILTQQLLLWTPSTDPMCGRVDMKPGETWIVGGRMDGIKPTISLCSLATRWSEVSGKQRKGFRQLYRGGCVCQISYTQWWNKGAVLDSAAGKRCLWESAPGPSDCQEKYGICMYGTAGCSWMPSVAYNKCIVRHKRYREQQRSREP